MRIGNYDIVRQIGEGGFGRTYEARHILLGTRACIKQNSNITDDDAKLLMDEARVLWDVHHHSLPSMHDFYRAPDGSYIMVMSFVEGKNLEDIVKKHKAIHPEDVSWVTQRLLNALHYLHASGVIHGDVKPPNVIVQPRVHNAVLVDYGLASVRPRSTTKPMGYTAMFAAPEILDGKPPIPESDLYSLGLTMVYTLGGDVVSKIMPETVPAPLQEFFAELTRYNPLDRPNWDKCDLVARLSDIRQDVFGRRSTK